MSLRRLYINGLRNCINTYNIQFGISSSDADGWILPISNPIKKENFVSGWKMSIKLNLDLDAGKIFRPLKRSWLGNFFPDWIKTGTVRSLNTKNAE